MVVAGPPGFCVDRQATRSGSDGGAFVLMGSCAALARDASAPQPDTPAVLTVSVSGGVADADAMGSRMARLTRYFDTPAGRAALSRSGDPDGVEVLETRAQDGMLYIHVSDRSGAGKGMSDTYWRVLFAVNDRLLTASLSGFADIPLPPGAGPETLGALASRTLAETARAGAAG